MGREKNQNLSFFSRYDSCYAYVEVKKKKVSGYTEIYKEDNCKMREQNTDFLW